MAVGPEQRPIRRLSELLGEWVAVRPADDRDIGGLALDSRQVRAGDLFLACAGGRTHGMRFADAAIAAGAAAIAYDPAGAQMTSGAAVPVIAVEGLGALLGDIAARFHGQPARRMTVVGITGTNGKTSCCHYIAQALAADGAPCGVIGTLGYGLYGALRPGPHTTPDAVTLQAELARMRDAGAGRVVMEVSSHALAQGRVNAVAFAAAVFTNLSHEHLDYHGDLAGYGAAKKTLFLAPGLSFAVINRGDAFGRELITALPESVQCIEYGLGSGNLVGRTSRYVWGDIERQSLSGIGLRVRSSWGEAVLEAPLIGRFNAENLLAVLAALLGLGMPLVEAVRRLRGLRAVPGRMERFGGGVRPLVVVDYAHTPDALEQVLRALTDLAPRRLWCVFGCGGERDRAKRPLMGAIAARYADHTVLTNDNPRSEDPAAIIEEIRGGMPAGAEVDVIPDRSVALRHAIAAAGGGDVVLVAGKGHEDYQLIGEHSRPFSDRLQVQAILEEAA